MRRALFFLGAISACGAFALFVACSSPYSGAVGSTAGDADGNADSGADSPPPDSATIDAPGTYCETVDATFCDDFETLTNLDASFVAAQSGGTIFLTDGGAPLSPLHSVRAITPATDDGGVAGDGGNGVSSAAIGRAFAVIPTSTLTLDADLRIVEGVPAANTTLLYALGLLGPDPNNPSVFVNIVPGGISVLAADGQSDAASPAQVVRAPAAIAIGSWFHVRIEVHRGSESFVSVAVGGELVASMTTSILDDLTAVSLAAGVVSLRGAQTNVVDVDNLVFDSY